MREYSKANVKDFIEGSRVLRFLTDLNKSEEQIGNDISNMEADIINFLNFNGTSTYSDIESYLTEVYGVFIGRKLDKTNEERYFNDIFGFVLKNIRDNNLLNQSDLDNGLYSLN